MKCKLYSEITVEIGTKLKTVKITSNIFAVHCNFTVYICSVPIPTLATVYTLRADCWLTGTHGTLAVAGQSGGCKIYKSWTLLVSLPQSILLFQLTIIIPIHLYYLLHISE